MHIRHQRCGSQQGFTLIEMLVVLLILTVLMGIVFKTMRSAQARSSAEQNKLDQFQEAREFMDQISRDLHQAGYPNARMYSTGSTTSASTINLAVGLVKVDVGELRFEGDVDGDGTVDSLDYQLISTGNNCPCLRRSQLPKIASNPLTGQTAPQFNAEVQNVQNGTAASNAIFKAFKSDGTQVTLPVDITTNGGADIASIKTIQVILTVQGTIPDVETKQTPQSTLEASIKLNNCPAAATGQPMSCF